jgi:dTMP kinase
VFITFEGPEGSGKSTQIQKLGAHLQERGLDCIVTKEPGGTPIADRIRAIVLDSAHAELDPWAEVLLYSASRRQHTIEKIRPALARGTHVLCDRYIDATIAYQGYGRVIDLGRLEMLNAWATENLVPDVTLLYDIDEETGLARANHRNAAMDVDEGRFEAEDLRFHRRVREGYLAMAVAEPKRFIVIDGSGTIDDVFERTLAALRPYFP